MRWVVRTGVVASVVMLLTGGARAASTYAIDERYGTLGFEVVEAGIFTSKGLFRKFAGALTLDFADPEHSSIDVSAEAASADIPGPGAIEMLRSPDYFDVEHFPKVHFVSSRVVKLGDNRFRIDGTLEIRGTVRPQVFEATLSEQRQENGGAVADFLVTGGMQRSQFGMLADRNFISDTVRLVIRVHLAVGG